MKTMMIDLKSLCLGVALMGAMLLMANKPAPQPVAQPDPANEVRRFQAVTTESRIIIVDTKTGRFILEKQTLGVPRWIKGDFEEIMQQPK